MPKDGPFFALISKVDFILYLVGGINYFFEKSVFLPNPKDVERRLSY
jgi:hypothetical protein